MFLFHFENSFRSRKYQILEFYIFKFHDVIKFLSIKQEIHFTEKEDYKVIKYKLFIRSFSKCYFIINANFTMINFTFFDIINQKKKQVIQCIRWGILSVKLTKHQVIPSRKSFKRSKLVCSFKDGFLYKKDWLLLMFLL